MNTKYEKVAIQALKDCNCIPANDTTFIRAIAKRIEESAMEAYGAGAVSRSHSGEVLRTFSEWKEISENG